MTKAAIRESAPCQVLAFSGEEAHGTDEGEHPADENVAGDTSEMVAKQARSQGVGPGFLPARGDRRLERAAHADAMPQAHGQSHEEENGDVQGDVAREA